MHICCFLHLAGKNNSIKYEIKKIFEKFEYQQQIKTLCKRYCWL